VTAERWLRRAAEPPHPEQTQREADHNTQAVSPTYLRGVEQARLAGRIRAALGEET
jgi:hypothetical protein